MAVYNLNQAAEAGLDSAGGKGANLGELISAGLPVPPGFVVSADAYAACLLDFTLPSNSAMAADAAPLLESIRAHILGYTMPDLLTGRCLDEINAIAARYDNKPVFAVRSSATAEDLADASFAGQHETYYYVTAEKLPLMIKKCWASMWSDAAFSYRQAQGIEHRSVNMAVVVQVMIPSEVSGVTFGADPVSGDTTVVITESSWGMGAAIVDGRVSPDHYRVDKSSAETLQSKVSDKKFMVAATITEDESPRLIPVPANLRRQASLNDDQVRKITELAIQCEQHFCAPQDLEWALAGNQLYLLQSRAITTLGHENEPYPDGRYLLFKPVAENFTDPLMPLTVDLLAPMVPMMKVIRGRLYLNFNQVKALIPLKLSDQNLARLAYLSSSTEASGGVSIIKALLLLPVLFLMYLSMGVFTRRCADMPDDFMNHFRQFADAIAADETITPPATFIRLFTRFRLSEPAGHMVMLVNLVAPRYMLFLNVLKALIKKWAPDLPEDTASQLCSGTQGVLSTQMGRDILGLAAIARATPEVAASISSHQQGDLRAQLEAMPEAADFCAALTAFLSVHGHRALKEFELCAVRWDEDPAPVLGMVKNYLSAEENAGPKKTDTVSRQQACQAQLEQALLHLPLEQSLGVRRHIINHLKNETQYYMKLRENSRFFHIMGFYALRKKILRIEHELLGAGKLKCRDDIFYLKWHEIVDLRESKIGWSDIETLIRNRRQTHIRDTKIAPPKTIGFEFNEPAGTAHADRLTGQPASPGEVEGIARVIMDPATDNEISPGEILIAPFTDPAWTPLFLTASAAVVEVGSYLSHAGTIAREYGMPCVVDVEHCTSRINNGDRIRVDGTTGSVEKLAGSTATKATDQNQVGAT